VGGGHVSRLTIQALRRRGQRLKQAEDALHAAFEVVILGQDSVPETDDVLQFLKGLLALEFFDASFEILNRVLGALSDGALGFAVVGALLGQLLWREVCHSARRCAVGLAFPAILHRHVRCVRDRAIAGIVMAVVAWSRDCRRAPNRVVVHGGWSAIKWCASIHRGHCVSFRSGR